MNIKSLGKVFLSAILAAALLCGCSDNPESGTPSTSSSSSIAANVPDSSSEPTSSTESVSESSSESTSSTESVPESSSEPTSSTESVPESSSEPTSSTESVPESSSELISSTESVPESSSEPISSTESVPESSGNSSEEPSNSDTYFGRHGVLSVNGANLVDAHGEKMQLRGMSTHGIAWFPDFVNMETFKFLRDEWNTNCVRLAMYTHEYNGYCAGGDKEWLKGLVKSGVEYATELGMYVIVDWHVLNEQNPLTYKDEALKFFDEMSKYCADKGNVIYEICNEPNGSGSWGNVTAYANEVIPVIRANDPDSVILVGTPTWSQDIDQALNSPLNFDNIMYTLHFYAATHTDWLRSRMESCVNSGLPVFISEFGMCDASGNGAIDTYQSEQWKAIIDKYGTSYMCWNLANKNESSSILRESCRKLSGWTDDDLSQQGQIIRGWFLSETEQ